LSPWKNAFPFTVIGVKAKAGAIAAARAANVAKDFIAGESRKGYVLSKH
jgi:hypothetical protein